MLARHLADKIKENVFNEFPSDSELSENDHLGGFALSDSHRRSVRAVSQPGGREGSGRGLAYGSQTTRTCSRYLQVIFQGNMTRAGDYLLRAPPPFFP